MVWNIWNIYINEECSNLYCKCISFVCSFLKENCIHMAHNEGNMDRVGLQGPFCRYGLTVCGLMLNATMTQS